MLRANNEPETLSAIDAELTKSLGSIGGGFDVAIFMLQKDLLIFQCKLAIAILNFDNDKIKIYQKKVNELSAELKKKAKVAEKPNPYKSFLSWIISVEKYMSICIDRENDLLYFSEATKQMLNFYDNQTKQIEIQNAKNKKK